MKAFFTTSLCALGLGLAVPAAALAQDAPMHHHHHHMHGKHGMGKMSKRTGDNEVDKLNQQSLENARAGRTPASGSAATDEPSTLPTAGKSSGGMGNGAMSNSPMGKGETGPGAPTTPPGTPAMANAPNNVPGTAAPGTGMAAPANPGTTAPANTPESH